MSLSQTHKNNAINLSTLLPNDEAVDRERNPALVSRLHGQALGLLGFLINGCFICRVAPVSDLHFIFSAVLDVEDEVRPVVRFRGHHVPTRHMS